MSLQTILDKVTLITRDYGEEFQARVTGDGTTLRFDLPKTNVTVASVNIESSPPVTLTPAVAFPPGTGEYSLDDREGVITLGTPVALGIDLVVEGTGDLFITPADLQTYVEIAFDLHNRNRIPALTWDNISPAEEYALALLAVREALWSEVAEAANQLDVTTPEGMHIPGGEHFQQLSAMLDRASSHYQEFAEALNVGPFRIENFDLRRVSRTTNKLVPLYVPQEVDDESPPVRIYPPIDQGF